MTTSKKISTLMFRRNSLEKHQYRFNSKSRNQNQKTKQSENHEIEVSTQLKFYMNWTDLMIYNDDESEDQESV